MTAPADAPPAGVQLRRLAAERIRRLCVVPEALTVTEWADKYRMLPETSTSPGPYNSAVTPYARRPQDCLADPTIDTVVLCWAAQTTKSTVLENGLAYRICRTPSPMVVVQPKIDSAEAWAKERFVPMVRSTPALRERVNESTSTLRYKEFPGGFLFVASAQSATELASRSSPFVLCDEVDRYEVIPGEGNPVEIVKRRGGAADIGLVALTSTPRHAETTIIWPYLEAGTFELYYVPCPHCGTMQPLVWKGPRGEKGLRWTKGKPEEAVYICGSGLEADADGVLAGCGGEIEHAAKRDMLAAGEWVATNPEGRYPSFHLNALYSPFAKTSWAVLAAEWEKAQEKSSDLQVFINTMLAETWRDTTITVEADSLLSRLAPFEQGVVPTGVGALTFGADVQANRIEVYVWGWGEAMRSWLIDHHIIAGDPERETTQPGTVWARLAEYVLRKFPHEHGGEVGIAAGLIDSGHATTQVYNFTHRRGSRRVFACKGVAGRQPLLGKPTLQGKRRTVLYPIGVDEAKSQFLRSQILEANPNEAGYVHLPTWLATDQVDQLVAEELKRRYTRQGAVFEWRLKREDAPNEALDCRNYARAALELLGAKTIAKLGETAAKLATPPQREADGSAPREPEAESSPPRRRRQRGGWVDGWR